MIIKGEEGLLQRGKKSALHALFLFYDLRKVCDRMEPYREESSITVEARTGLR